MTASEKISPRGTDMTNLRLLAVIRCILAAGQGIALVISRYYLELDLNYTVLVSALLILLGLALYSFLKENEASITEFFLHLVADMTILTVVLYFTGGSTNPFVSYYLVPLTISAAILPWGYTWIVAGMGLLLYTLLLFIYQPLQIFSTSAMHDSSTMNPHIVGMWINFVMSALLITYFVVRMARQIRIRDEQLHRANEDRIRDEQIMSLATMAAGTAHELGTPLSTVSVLLHEMRNDLGTENHDSRSIDLMLQQVERCKETLKNLVETAERNSNGKIEPIAADKYVSGILDNWRVMRPAAKAELTTTGERPVPNLEVDSTLTQAITNLLNNAADASLSGIEVQTWWSEGGVHITIRDHGKGIDPEVVDELGKPFITTKSSGLGVGLFLAEAAIRRHNGQLHFQNHPEGGAIASVTLPQSVVPEPAA